MADVPEVTAYQAVPGLGSEREGSRRGSAGEQGEERREHRRPEARTPRQIADVASVMGIPAKELTPRVHEALELILNEFDRLRWEVEVGQRHEERLQSLADVHPYLPVLNRRALYAQMVRLAEHAARTETISTLVLLAIINADAIKAAHGIAGRDAALRHAADVIRAQLREIDLVGSIGGGDFGIILNVTGTAEAEKTAAAIADALAGAPAELDGTTLALEAAWGTVPLAEERAPDETVAEAEAALRRKLATR